MALAADGRRAYYVRLLCVDNTYLLPENLASQTQRARVVASELVRTANGKLKRSFMKIFFYSRAAAHLGQFGCLAAVVLMSLLAPPVLAQSFPSKPARIIVGFAPGGGSDIVARLMAQKLTEMWGQSVVVENRPGASGIIGTDAVAKAAPDGYTMLVTSATSTAVAASLYTKLPYNVQKDLAIASVIGTTPTLLVVNPALPAKTLSEFIAYARSNSSKVFFGGSGIGSSGHLTGELFNSALRIKTNHVPYKGELPGLTDVIGGNLTFMFSSVPVSLPLVRSGQLRALAVTGLQRTSNAPDIPSVAELGHPELESVSWNAIYLPAAVPAPILARISADAAKALQMPDVRERLRQLGIEPVGGTPERATAYLQAEITKWAKVIREANVRVD